MTACHHGTGPTRDTPDRRRRVDRGSPDVVGNAPRSAGARKAQGTMAIDTVDQTGTTQDPSTTSDQRSSRTETRRQTSTSPGGPEMAPRIVALVFGLIQLVIGLRFILLLLD